jgi:hypothetical protein
VGRFTRQVKLAEIGRRGQAKIEAATAVSSAGFAGWVEARYLAAAGVGNVQDGTHELVDARFDGLDPAAREVALGAHAAVVTLMKLVR